MSSITAAVRMSRDCEVRLAVAPNAIMSTPVFSDPVETVSRSAKMTVTGLTPGTQYWCAVEADGTIDMNTLGTFTTPQTGAHSFKIAFAGDGLTGTNAAVFDTIRAQNPLMFIHLGDLHYENIATNSPDLFRAAFNSVLSSARQGQLYREVPTAYVWDDHDFGANNSNGSSASRPAACEVYRERVPHYPLEEEDEDGAIYHSFTIGRVMFIMTDQRSRSSSASATDNSSKTMLGTAQKTWFKNLLADPDNEDKFFVWVCPRTWVTAASAGADHWGGFTTEQTELMDHIKTYCVDRICILSADAHFLAIDDGSNADYATGGGAPIPAFQCAPLDHGTRNASHGGGTFSEGSPLTANGQFGTMEITDEGGDTITVDWTGYNTAGSVIKSYSFEMSLAA